MNLFNPYAYDVIASASDGSEAEPVGTPDPEIVAVLQQIEDGVGIIVMRQDVRDRIYKSGFVTEHGELTDAGRAILRLRK